MIKQKLGLLGTAGLGAGLGAGLMYVLDPDKGGRRRASARHQALRALKEGRKAASKGSRKLGKQARGLIAEAGSKLRQGAVDNQMLSQVGLVAGQVLSNVRAIKRASKRAEAHERWPRRRNAIGAALGAISLSLLAQNLTQRRGPAV